MKAKELMIGDWVMDTRSNTPLRVNPFLAQLEVPEWKPVPLTREILSENDWVDDGVYATLFYTTNIAVEFYFHEGILRIYFNNELTYQSLPGINYVHTLQHHLRLCGIEKEIVV